jgi:hypothetical protein
LRINTNKTHKISGEAAPQFVKIRSIRGLKKIPFAMDRCCSLNGRGFADKTGIIRFPRDAEETVGRSQDV